MQKMVLHLRCNHMLVALRHMHARSPEHKR
jgi:hypothetical protein